MEGLDLLKKAWSSQDESLPKYKSRDFYEMILKKSSSMVKWIFYISVIEFIFWIGLSIALAIFDKDSTMHREEFLMFNWIDNTIFYIVIVYFMVKFYRNYRRIESNDSVKGLMENILNTRRTVKHYVWFNLLFFAISYIVALLILYNSDGLGLPENADPTFAIMAFIVVLLVFLAILVLFYRLLYGILTRRLKKNYKELERIEV